MRLGIYTDYAYHRIGDEIYAERAFALFLAHLARERKVERLVLIGRLDSSPTGARYHVGNEVDFVPLPFYSRLSAPLSALRGMPGSLRRFWHALREVDAVWLLGPHPLVFLFTVAAILRRKRVVLGVRQNLPSYVRMRHPGLAAGIAATLLESAFRALGRFCDVIAVGPALSHDYRHSRRVLEIAISLIEDSDIVDPSTIRERPYDGQIKILSVGRLDREKNPLLLGDVIASLNESDPRWQLTICGEGPLRASLAERLKDLGVEDKVELCGYLTHDDGLKELYRDSHLFLHVSWTEGLPQVLFEAFAAGLPVVATDVGGIAAAVGDAVKLVPPGDALAAAKALRSVADDTALREQMLEAGHRIATATTLDSEAHRVAEFISAA